MINANTCDTNRLPVVQPGHAALNVTDLKRSTDFFVAALGLDVLAQSDQPGAQFAFLGQNGRLLLTLWPQSEGRFDAHRPGLHHLSFELPSMDAVRAAEERLRALGAKIHHGGLVSHGEGIPSGGLYFEDPDGTRVEIFSATGAEDLSPATAHGPSCGFF
jgi:lactoylglutathione lyase